MTTYAQLGAMSTEQLRILNTTVCAIIKQRLKSKAFDAARNLYVGQDVKWTGRSGLPMHGIVTKVKIKMVEINAGSAGLWNVTASMLSPV